MQGFPQRHPNHILESASWKLLHAAIPPQWILREISERDYGIDAYLELVASDGLITGDLVSLQLKGKANLDWKDGLFAFAGTRKETINYWMNLAVPVFLCVADGETGRVWFIGVKDHVRRVHHTFLGQTTLTFPIRAECTFNTPEGLKQFLRAYERERQQQRFAFDLMSLLSNCSHYAEFCEDRSHRDGHLPLEPHNLLTFAHLHGIARTVATHLGLEWSLKSMSDLQKEDRAWKGGQRYLHEGTVLVFVREFAPKLADIIEAARNHVAVEYADYWRATNPLLFESCGHATESSYLIDQSVEKLRQEF